MKKKLLFLLFLSSIILHASDIIIEAVEFEGNVIFSEQKLSSVILSKPGIFFQQKVALEDAQRLSDFYEINGYYHIKIFPPQTKITDSGKIIVIFKIEEKEKINIDQFVLEGNQYVEFEVISTHVIFTNRTLHDVSEVLVEIVDFYTFQGFLFAKAEIDNISLEKNELIVKILIDEGRFCRFEEYIFQGNKITKESTLLQISQLDNVRIITPNILQSAQENLRKKPYISHAEIIPINYQTALIKIEETNMTYFSGVVGYDNREEQTNRLNGYLN